MESTQLSHIRIHTHTHTQEKEKKYMPIGHNNNKHTYTHIRKFTQNKINRHSYNRYINTYNYSMHNHYTLHTHTSLHSDFRIQYFISILD